MSWNFCQFHSIYNLSCNSVLKNEDFETGQAAQEAECFLSPSRPRDSSRSRFCGTPRHLLPPAPAPSHSPLAVLIKALWRVAKPLAAGAEEAAAQAAEAAEAACLISSSPYPGGDAGEPRHRSAVRVQLEVSALRETRITRSRKEKGYWKVISKGYLK